MTYFVTLRAYDCTINLYVHIQRKLITYIFNNVLIRHWGCVCIYVLTIQYKRKFSLNFLIHVCFLMTWICLWFLLLSKSPHF